MPGQLNNTESSNTAGYQGNLFTLIWKLKAPGNWIFLVTGSFVWCSSAVYPINDTISRTLPSCGCLFPPCFVFDLLNCKKSSGNKRKKKLKANSSAPLLQKFKTSKYTSLSASREMKKSGKWKYIHMYTHEQNMSHSHGNLGSSVPNKKGYSSKQSLCCKI